MTWIKVDDQFADHPKVMALGADRLQGLGLWQVAASYCARYLTDGFVPTQHVTAHAPKKLVNRLVAVGLFDVVDGGYQLHDWLRYNPSRQEVEQMLAKKRAAGQAGGRASGQARAQADASPPAQAESKPVPVPVPGPVPADISTYIEPADLYFEKVGRKPGQKERDWLEDLHVRFSRTELVRGMMATPGGRDFLKRLDAFMEGRAA